MTKMENLGKELVEKLISCFDKLEFRARIGDTSRSVEFFVWIDGERKQCYELADSAKIDEEAMERLFDDFAESVRKSDEYKRGEVNKVQFET